MYSLHAFSLLQQIFCSKIDKDTLEIPDHRGQELPDTEGMPELHRHIFEDREDILR